MKPCNFFPVSLIPAHRAATAVTGSIALGIKARSQRRDEIELLFRSSERVKTSQ